MHRVEIFDGEGGTSIRPEVKRLAQAGILPSEEATAEELKHAQRVLADVASPLSDDEAQALIFVFGEDNCFGLTWTLLHLIESAPNALTADYSARADNEWVRLLIRRQDAAAQSS